MAMLKWRAVSGLRRIELRPAIYILVLIPGLMIAPIVAMLLCRTSLGRSTFTSEERTWIVLLGICNVVLSAVLLSRIGGTLLVPLSDALGGRWFPDSSVHARGVLKI